MRIDDFKWSSKEKKIARTAFDRAIVKELEELIQATRARAENISSPDDLWELSDFLYQSTAVPL